MNRWQFNLNSQRQTQTTSFKDAQIYFQTRQRRSQKNTRDETVNARKLTILEERVQHYTPLVGEFFGIEMPEIEVIPFSMEGLLRIPKLKEIYEQQPMSKWARRGLVLKNNLSVGASMIYSEGKGYVIHQFGSNFLTKNDINYAAAHEVSHIGHHHTFSFEQVISEPFEELVADYIAAQLVKKVPWGFFQKAIDAKRFFAQFETPKETIKEFTKQFQE